MVDPLSGGDVSPQSPQETFDPFQPLASQFNQLESMLNIAFDDFGELISKITSRVLDMPPEERFTESVDEVADLLEEEFGSGDVFNSKLPVNADQLIPLVNEGFNQLMEKILSGTFIIRNPEDHLLLVSAIHELRVGLNQAHKCKEDVEFAEGVDERQLLSSVSAIWARIYSIKDEEGEAIKDDLAHDIVRSLYFRTDAIGRPELSVYPEGIDTAHTYRIVRHYGAAIAYASLDISLSRGAELAELSLDEFKELLKNRGVSIRYGPRSVDELKDDSMLHEQ